MTCGHVPVILATIPPWAWKVAVLLAAAGIALAWEDAR